MCGIVGLLRFDGAPADRAVLDDMAAALAHRGPDGHGVWSHGPFGLGHRRLAIIDPEGGHQPMGDQEGRTWLSYNGEIYNFRELRGALEARGHRFRTSCDTEVLLAAYREWGPGCVERLRGMFAFAVADLDAGTLFLARDHFGIKPLYFVDTPRVLAFASELQAFRKLPELEREIDLESVDLYLRLQYIPAPRTIYRRVRKLGPAERLTVTIGGGAGPTDRYWRPAMHPDPGPCEDEWLERLDAAITESVRSHLVADVDFGAFLSGGIDSTLIVTAMARQLARPVRTFTIGFQEPGHDESVHAQKVARRWDTDHHVEVLRPDAIGILPDLVRHYGEPFGDSSAIPTYYVSRLAARSVPMVLSGDGGDELFAGYDTYRGFARWLSFEGAPGWKRLMYPIAHRLLPRRYPRRIADARTWLAFTEIVAHHARRRLWRPELRPATVMVPERLAREARSTSPAAPVTFAQTLDLTNYLPFVILTKVDVASMMSGLEVRTPLVDRRVFDLAAAIPPELNFGRGPDGISDGKRLLKKLLERDFPADLVHRRKTGFGAPIGPWFGPSGSLRSAVHDRLLAPASPLHELFRPTAVRSLLHADAAWPLWLLLFLDEWLRQQRATDTG